jgi:hypothetical protein
MEKIKKNELILQLRELGADQMTVDLVCNDVDMYNDMVQNYAKKGNADGIAAMSHKILRKIELVKRTKLMVMKKEPTAGVEDFRDKIRNRAK